MGAVAWVLGCTALAQAHSSRAFGVPAINGAADLTVDATSGCGQSFCAIVDPTIGLTATETGYTPNQITISCNNPSTTHPVGTSLVTCTAHDPAGGFSTVQFHTTVTVPPPSFQNVPAPIT